VIPARAWSFQAHVFTRTTIEGELVAAAIVNQVIWVPGIEDFVPKVYELLHPNAPKLWPHVSWQIVLPDVVQAQQFAGLVTLRVFCLERC
jgi:hypothetical protein